MVRELALPYHGFRPVAGVLRREALAAQQVCPESQRLAAKASQLVGGVAGRFLQQGRLLQLRTGMRSRELLVVGRGIDVHGRRVQHDEVAISYLFAVQRHAQEHVVQRPALRIRNLAAVDHTVQRSQQALYHRAVANAQRIDSLLAAEEHQVGCGVVLDGLDGLLGVIRIAVQKAHVVADQLIAEAVYLTAAVDGHVTRCPFHLVSGVAGADEYLRIGIRLVHQAHRALKERLTVDGDGMLRNTAVVCPAAAFAIGHNHITHKLFGRSKRSVSDNEFGKIAGGVPGRGKRIRVREGVELFARVHAV